jgi:hypothetical protein
MKFSRKTMTAIITLVLTLTIASTLIVALPPVQSQEVIEPVIFVPEWIFVAASPDPIGVGQGIYIIYFTRHLPPPTFEDPTLGAPGGRETFIGITLTITAPDNSKQTIDMPPTAPDGSGWYIYNPDQVGTYSVQASFPGAWKNSTEAPPWGSDIYFTYPASYYFEPADSEIETFTVQQDPIEPWPAAELPTEYWTRPIDSGLREWSTIAGNWLNDGRDNPYTTGPKTAHIVWTKPFAFGGITGEPYGHIGYYEGSSYERKWRSPIIMQGRLYYNQPHSSVGSPAEWEGVRCLDLRTGEEIWYKNGTSIEMGQIYNYYSRNQHGTIPYLWDTGSTSNLYDPFSGEWCFTIENVPSGAAAIGPHGERLIYILGGPEESRTWLALWNSTAPLSMTGISAAALEAGVEAGTGYDQWRPLGKIHDGNDGYSWNVTLPPGLSDVRYYGMMPRGTTAMTVLEDRVLGGSGFTPSMRPAHHGNYEVWAVSTAKDSLGDLIFHESVPLPYANASMAMGSASLEEGVFVLRVTESRQWMGFDINTGKQLWITDSQPSWMMYSTGSRIADGKLFSGGYGGVMYAYDIKTGELLWTASTDLCGLESVYPRWPISTFYVIDGKVYARTGEHSHSQPLYRGWAMYCWDAKTGEHLWNITGVWTDFAFADGYLIGGNGMDNQIYCFGKGPTQTTVEAPLASVPKGTSVIIQGTVIDKSPGAMSPDMAARYSNGLPAIADVDMTAWMEHVYKQHELPMDATGVPVTIDAIDPDGNFFNIGTTTSDMAGLYSYMWEPEDEGKYTIIATFEGSDSYFASYAETAIAVGPVSPGIEPTTEPPTTAPPTSAPPPTGEAPLISTEVAIAISVIIAAVIGIAAYWTFRIRKAK